MPSNICVVQDCSNISNTSEGISLHISPTEKKEYAKWKKFVQIHRANFKPAGRFVICSNHFEDNCFERSYHVAGRLRRLKKGSCPTIWKCTEERPSARNHRQVKIHRLIHSSIHSCKIRALLFPAVAKLIKIIWQHEYFIEIKLIKGCSNKI